MSNSSLATYRRISPKSSPRTEKISKIIIHHWSGVISTAKAGVDYFCSEGCLKNRNVSATYVIGNDGSIGQNVDESRRQWTTSSNWADQRGVSIEVSNSKTGGDWPISDAAMKSLINLCVDICQRNGIKKLYYDGTKNGTLLRHCQFSNTDCPGTYIKNHTTYICDEVNKRLGHKVTTVNASTSNPYTRPTMVLNKNNAAYGKKYGGRSQVKWIHWELQRLGYYNGDADGYFGPMTESSVKAFQREHKDLNGNQLEADGSVGPLTRDALEKAVKVSKNGNPYTKPTMVLNSSNAAYGKKYAGTSEVKWIHWELTRLGYYMGDIDGFFGPLTVQAVKVFQLDHKDQNGHQLEADGSVGPLTREALARA